MATLVTHIRLNSEQISAACAELLSLMPKLADLRPEILDRLLNLPDIGRKLIRIERGAAIAGELTLVAKPSDGLDELLAALRADNHDLALVEQAIQHLCSSSSELAPEMLSESGPG
ncbi:hypothetical protein [Pseudorhodoplanes sinuspersici]|uniref:hypothetical protein n=1 Tax=Pseudorhodoplanes sinuspersici TaxID=1235591 RepID=UPI000FF35240|nr:hypothetical protein [Pseudorhodoplanes sinuspersici]RKE73677.1 hypothetical protein DFP91_1572 [Pseudorhodoplanes sinuspersici]